MIDDRYAGIFFRSALFLLLLVTATAGASYAQNVSGVTHVPDTSFTSWSAYVNTLKSHPDAKIVPEFKLKSVKEKRDITYCTLGERNLQLDAFYPSKRTKEKQTAIVIIHGGGWRSGNRAQHYPLAQKLASMGYVCFTPEYRLSTEALYPAAVYDLKAALKWVYANADQYNVDTSKISVLGFSAGGELAAFLGVTVGNPKYDSSCNGQLQVPIHAVVDIDGTLSFVHPESGEGDDSKKPSAATYWFGYSKKDNPELWKDASPLTHVGAHTPPFMFINSGVNRMHAGRDDFMKVLRQNNIYVGIQSFGGAPHPFCLFEPWFEPTVNFIDEFLKNLH
jgi:pectinesterase